MRRRKSCIFVRTTYALSWKGHGRSSEGRGGGMRIISFSALHLVLDHMASTGQFSQGRDYSQKIHVQMLNECVTLLASDKSITL